ADLAAAVARQRVARSKLAAPGGGALLEQPVAGLVTALVVVVLEEVDVEHRDPKRIAVSTPRRQFRGPCRRSVGATTWSRASRSERSSAIAVSAASIRMEAAIRFDPSTGW